MSGSRDQSPGVLDDAQILDLVRRDDWMMAVLRAAKDYGLPDWMIGAGFIRNKVWDQLHGVTRDMVLTSDIDLIYFDPEDLSTATERDHDRRLSMRLDVPWSVKNQARMHLKNNRPAPYENSTAALADWIETPTCIALHLDQQESLSLIAPHGIDDLIHLIVRPVSDIPERRAIYRRRIAVKNWTRQWPRLTILDGGRAGRADNE